MLKPKLCSCNRWATKFFNNIKCSQTILDYSNVNYYEIRNGGICLRLNKNDLSRFQMHNLGLIQ